LRVSPAKHPHIFPLPREILKTHNTLVIDAVIQFGVKYSVTEGRLGVLAFFERAAYQIGGHRFSLTDIEHGILRTNRGFPYLPGSHFASDDPRKKNGLSRILILGFTSLSIVPDNLARPLGYTLLKYSIHNSIWRPGILCMPISGRIMERFNLNLY